MLGISDVDDRIVVVSNICVDGDDSDSVHDSYRDDRCCCGADGG